MSHQSFRSMLEYVLPSLKAHRINEAFAPVATTLMPDVLEKVAQKFIASLKPEAVKNFNGRLDRGLELAKNGAVVACPEPAHSRCFQVRSSDGKSSYKVDLEARTCECPDSLKGNTCKHRIAAYYFEQAAKICPVKTAPAPTPIKVIPQPVTPSSPISREDQILAELGFAPEAKTHKDDQPAGFKLGMLYRRFLHGSDLAQQTFKVTIQDITKETVMPHPSLPTEEKWCLWVTGLPEGMPSGILFGAIGERDLMAVFGPMGIDQLKGKSIAIFPKPMNVGGQTKIAIRFRSAQ